MAFFCHLITSKITINESQVKKMELIEVYQPIKTKNVFLERSAKLINSIVKCNHWWLRVHVIFKGVVATQRKARSNQPCLILHHKLLMFIKVSAWCSATQQCNQAHYSCWENLVFNWDSLGRLHPCKVRFLLFFVINNWLGAIHCTCIG